MQAHIDSVHNGKKPYQCPNCDHECLMKRDLKSHIQGIHTLFECEICRKFFPKKYRLKLHKEQVHEKKKLFECEVCNQSFVYRKHLKKHVTGDFL